jgi:hypothetical protein
MSHGIVLASPCNKAVNVPHAEKFELQNDIRTSDREGAAQPFPPPGDLDNHRTNSKNEQKKAPRKRSQVMGNNPV